jgi:hypothetical protein
MTADPQLQLVDDGRDPTTLRDAEYGGTALPIIRQLLTTLRSRAGLVVVRAFFEPGSGPAPFCKVAREVWSGVHTSACDFRGSERQDAERNADRFEAVSLAAMAGKLIVDGERLPDLIATNPPFSAAMDFAEVGLELAPDVVLLLPDDWFKRKEDDPAEFIERGLDRTLVVQLQIPGRIAFYGGSGTDRVSYSWWHFSSHRDELWRSYQNVPNRWRTELLPMLPSSERRWAGFRPGCEP